ncbi:MAG: WG repeat-containing protein [Gammaproteobacteria bacterium]|nr:WG repeat-containing protein [Gammaproteobacteria bacterium]
MMHRFLLPVFGYLPLFFLILCASTKAAPTGSVPQEVDPRDFPKASFHQGLAAVRLGEKYGYIDRSGRVVIAPRFQFAQIFSEGLARVVDNDRSGYIDQTGRVVITPQFHKAYKFSDGLARVCAPPRDPSFLFRLLRLIGWDDHNAYPCGYIDRTGKQVIDYLYLPSHGFENGYAQVTTLDGQEGYIDHAGKFYSTRPGE